MPNFYPRVTPKTPSETKAKAPVDVFHNPLSAWQRFSMPLSGDVTQAINPWTWTFGSATSQLGLVNINHVKLDELEPAERDAITKLRFQLEAVDRIKTGHRTTKRVTKPS